MKNYKEVYNLKSKIQNKLFHYGFQECIKNPSIEFIKIEEGKYLVLRFFGKTCDLHLEIYKLGETPCANNPVSQEMICSSFEVWGNGELLEKYLKK